jgi:hypothetical protein
VGRIFEDIDAWSIAALVALAMVGAWLLGRSIGTRLRREAQGARPAVSKFLDASLALLGLLLAFTFATAFSQHDQRRIMVVADSNAVGDFYNCASLLKEPVRTKTAESYSRLRGAPDRSRQTRLQCGRLRKGSRSI